MVAGVGIASTFGIFSTIVARNPRGVKERMVGMGCRGLATAEKTKAKRVVVKRTAFEERISWIFGQSYSWHCYRRRKTFLNHCAYTDKDLASTLETLGSTLAQHCRANQRELFMVTVLFYREKTAEGSFRRSFELLEKLQS
jgi:hypothetical protein